MAVTAHFIMLRYTKHNLTMNDWLKMKIEKYKFFNTNHSSAIYDPVNSIFESSTLENPTVFFRMPYHVHTHTDAIFMNKSFLKPMCIVILTSSHLCFEYR